MDKHGEKTLERGEEQKGGGRGGGFGGLFGPLCLYPRRRMAERLSRLEGDRDRFHICVVPDRSQIHTFHHEGRNASHSVPCRPIPVLFFLTTAVCASVRMVGYSCFFGAPLPRALPSTSPLPRPNDVVLFSPSTSVTALSCSIIGGRCVYQEEAKAWREEAFALLLEAWVEMTEDSEVTNGKDPSLRKGVEDATFPLYEQYFEHEMTIR